MWTARNVALHGLLATGMLLVALPPVALRAADDKDSLRDRALALNRVTGEDPIKGKILSLLENEPDARKLLAAAAELAKEKPQPFNFNGAYILARVAQQLKDIENGKLFFGICKDDGIKLRSGTKLSQSYLGLISMLYQAKQFAESEKVCREFLELDLQDDTVDRSKSLALQSMVEILARQGKIDEANKLIDNLLKIRPDNWLLLELKAEVQHEGGDFDGCARTYEQVLSLINKDDLLEEGEKTELANRVRYLLSGIYVDARKIDKAAEQLQTLLKKNPDSPTYNNDLGYIWADNDMHLEESERMIRKAIEEDRKQRKADPDLRPEDDRDNGAYLDSLGWVLFKQKKFEDARKYLLLAVEDKDSQHIEIYSHLGDAHMALGDKEKAIAAWKKGLEVVGTTRRDLKYKKILEEKLQSKP